VGEVVGEGEPVGNGETGHGAYCPAITIGLIGMPVLLIVPSVPKPFCAMSPVKRVTNERAGAPPASASARSSTPDPQVKAAGSIAPACTVHAFPPGTTASEPGAQRRPSEPAVGTRLRAALSHAGCRVPVASRKYVLRSG